jgi:hypothetical protein
MATVKHNKHLDFHWTPTEFFLSFLIGVAVVGALWIFSGLLVGVFFL